MSYTNVDMKVKRIIAILVCVVFLYWFVFARRNYNVKDLSIFNKKTSSGLKSKTKQVEEVEQKTIWDQQKSLRNQIESLQDENSILSGKFEAAERQIESLRLERASNKFAEQKTIEAEGEKVTIPVTPSYSFDGHRIVHIDMKGAPPSLDYLMSLFPLFKRNGVTGFLLEYEDMFPFTGKLSKLRSRNAYTKEALQQFLQNAKEEMFLIIPLVQTFGHLEFVLKHEEFAHLRALHDRSDALSPTNDESFEFVQSMIKQIIDFHSGIKILHLGGDEVWYLHNKTDAAQTYLDYMIPVLEHVKSFKLRVLIWEDMFRKWSLEDLEKIASVAEPMLWNYRTTLTLTNETISNYKKAFKGVWLASAFKGAERPNTIAVHIKSRIDNHLAWIDLLPLLKPMKVYGFALTGWSRFNHRSGLCELLPNSIPSLIACLDVIKTGRFDKRTMQYVSRELGFNEAIVIDGDNVYGHKPNLQTGSFPGYKIYHLNERLAEAQSNIIRIETLIQSWGSKFQQYRIGDIEDNFLSYFVTKCKVTRDILQEVKDSIRNVFTGTFDDDTTAEWLADQVNPTIKSTNRICKNVERLIKSDGHLKTYHTTVTPTEEMETEISNELVSNEKTHEADEGLDEKVKTQRPTLLPKKRENERVGKRQKGRTHLPAEESPENEGSAGVQKKNHVLPNKHQTIETGGFNENHDDIQAAPNEQGLKTKGLHTTPPNEHVSQPKKEELEPEGINSMQKNRHVASRRHKTTETVKHIDETQENSQISYPRKETHEIVESDKTHETHFLLDELKGHGKDRLEGNLENKRAFPLDRDNEEDTA